MKRRLILQIIVSGFIAVFAWCTENVSALAAQNSAPEIAGEVETTVDNTGYQQHVAMPQQAIDDAVLQADQIERSLLARYANENDLIVGTYNYGSLRDLKLTRLQAEIIKNGYIPILGTPGDAPIANPEKDYVEHDCGSSCSGGRAIMRCGTTPMAYDGYKTEYEVMVKGSKYGTSSGGYVCVGPNSIKDQCSGIYEQNPCINGTYQLDNEWLLSIGVNTAEIRLQIEALKHAESAQQSTQQTTPEPTPEPATEPAPTEPIDPIEPIE